MIVCILKINEKAFLKRIVFSLVNPQHTNKNVKRSDTRRNRRKLEAKNTKYLQQQPYYCNLSKLHRFSYLICSSTGMKNSKTLLRTIMSAVEVK